MCRAILESLSALVLKHRNSIDSLYRHHGGELDIGTMTKQHATQPSYAVMIEMISSIDDQVHFEYPCGAITALVFSFTFHCHSGGMQLYLVFSKCMRVLWCFSHIKNHGEHFRPVLMECQNIKLEMCNMPKVPHTLNTISSWKYVPTLLCKC